MCGRLQDIKILTVLTQLENFDQFLQLFKCIALRHQLVPALETVLSRFIFLFMWKYSNFVFFFSILSSDGNIQEMPFPATYFLTFCMAQNLCHTNFTHACELYSSLNVTKNLKSSILDNNIGTTTLVKTHSRSFEALSYFFLVLEFQFFCYTTSFAFVILGF